MEGTDGSGLTPSGEAARPKVVMKWSKKEQDWIISWPDRAGKTLSGIFFDMTKTTGHRIDWGESLISLLLARGYDPTTFRISVQKMKPKASPASPAQPEQKKEGNPPVTAGEERNIG